MTDPHLYALVLENNRLLKALTEGSAREKARETGRPMLKRDGLACGCVGAHTPACDRLDEAHRGVVAERSSKPLAESDMAHVLKTGEVPAAYSTTERLVRGQVADRITAILFPGPAQPNWTLEQALAGVANAAEGAKKWREREETATGIRALKSKPAPRECIVPGCVLPPGHVPHSNHRDASGKTWCTDVTDDYIASCAKPAPQPSGISGELPIHDFGWALNQMRAGKKVRQRQWDGVQFLEFQLKPGSIAIFEKPGGAFWRWNPVQGDILATDWEVVE